MIYATTAERVGRLQARLDELLAAHDDWAEIDGTRFDRLILETHHLPHTEKQEQLMDELLRVRRQLTQLPGFHSDLQRRRRVPVPA